MRKSVTTKFALFPAYFLLVIFLIGGVAINHAWSQPQTDGNVCDGLTGDAYGLCDAYCNAMKCGTEDQHASDRACERVLENFRKHHPTDPPCIDPCAKYVNTEDDECPCQFDQVPPTKQCWQDCTDCNHPHEFIPCSYAECMPTPPFPNTDGCRIQLTSTDPGSESILKADIYYDPAGQVTRSCSIKHADCSTANTFLTNLSAQQLTTCFCRLAQYTNELYEIGIDFTGGSYPYSCYP
jgi:hypothetical protein